MEISLKKINIIFLWSAIIGVAISYSSIYFFHVMLIIVWIFVARYLVKNNFKIKKLPTKSHYIFYFMLIWYFVGICWTLNYSYTIQYLLNIIFGLSIVLSVIYSTRSLDEFNYIFRSLSYLVIIEIILCLFEGFTSFRLPVSPFSTNVVYFGREMRIDNDLSSDILAEVLRGPTGFQWNPNNLSAMLMIACPFFLLHNDKKIKFFGVASILIIIALVASRANFFSYILMLISYNFFYTKRDLKKFIIYSVPIITISLAVFPVIHEFAVKDGKLERLFTLYDVATMYLSGTIEGSDSVGIRQQLILNGINALVETYGVGVGGGASKTVQELSNIDMHSTTSMHNFWIELLVEGGFIFFLPFAAWYFITIFKLYKIFKNSKHGKLKYYAGAASLSMIVFTVAAISASSVIYDLPMYILFGISISTLNLSRSIKNENSLAR